ncbi:2-hydroxy-3-keto-5-methylthiopentenyl-1-phosphate phosphatase [Bacillus thermotolerans]|uniref:2-hydroxy-3-keto-5-methylthiopentenyl-1-phosphate phosphatase n=2 Tax=Bacillus thermotolerans TaxID=1221996 RepID=A0A0F5I3G5_BACTR|nr:2-hydroxy-3-keto-5-methylthiopentenyl-1-phosphate phosphatase [Bacillus thermotolerans]KKB40214.1 2-hydroxy-3-keto-5-methylthiopentenyl-1-phosphate phosphatase [Bacillus thermotolerans]KKB43087.1 2-hydroxy-3-keto-5-methylthiopentenyl-1-phosphate phosphatase [Bacillus thermotolerans]
MKHFNPPGWEELKDGVLSQSISIQEGVGKMFQLLPSSLRQEIVNYVLETAEIREGFSDFVEYTKRENIPLYIVSGGIDFFVKPMLKPYDSIADVYCNEADFSGENIQILWPHSCDSECPGQNCGCCKPTIIRRLSEADTHAIVIGDSVTDLQAAKVADTVIARDYLSDKCKELSIPFQPFETFHDCIDILEGLNLRVK